MMPLKDPAKRREYHRKYMKSRFQNDPDFKLRHLKRVRSNTLKYRERVVSLLTQFKAAGCVVCGEADECCLSAHHFDPSMKAFSVGDAAHDGYTAEKVAEELRKCVCLCENCHRKVHAGRISLMANAQTNR